MANLRQEKPTGPQILLHPIVSIVLFLYSHIGATPYRQEAVTERKISGSQNRQSQYATVEGDEHARSDELVAGLHFRRNPNEPTTREADPGFDDLVGGDLPHGIVRVGATSCAAAG
jgi:hypothetical protein